MASVGKYKAKDGRIYTRILFVDPADGRRRTLRLGRVNKEQTATVKGMIERLVKSKATGTPDAVAGAWLAGLADTGYAKLVKTGLAEPRVVHTPEPEPVHEPGVCIGDFLDGYMKDRDDLKDGSKLVYGHTRRNLIDFFGREKRLNDITEYDGEQWQRYLMREGLSTATIGKRTTNAKAFFAAAVKQRLIPANPFQDLRSGSASNKQREYFLSRQDAQKVLDACPDSQWRLLFSLARFGGLRTPGETLLLKWSDVDWERGRITVTSPKTAHFPGKGSRDIPLFPELVKPLQEVFEQAPEGAVYVITRYRRANSNLRTQLERIIKRAGLEAWPRLFQNLRSTRETELVQTFPLHVVTAWIGNSQAIAAKHYLQVRDSDFEKATRTPIGATHRTAQSEAESTRNEPQTTSEPDHANRVLPVETAACELAQVVAGAGDGANEIRTHDLLHAMQALSQLSYGPGTSNRRRSLAADDEQP